MQRKQREGAGGRVKTEPRPTHQGLEGTIRIIRGEKQNLIMAFKITLDVGWKIN